MCFFFVRIYYKFYFISAYNYFLLTECLKTVFVSPLAGGIENMITLFSVTTKWYGCKEIELKKSE